MALSTQNVNAQQERVHMPHANTLQQFFWCLNVFFPRNMTYQWRNHVHRAYRPFTNHFYRGITGRDPWCGSSFAKHFLVLGHINFIFSSLDCKFPKICASKWNILNWHVCTKSGTLLWFQVLRGVGFRYYGLSSVDFYLSVW